MHRSTYVINAKNGEIYEVTIDIAKAEDGRLIAYAIKRNKEKIGNVALGSITKKVNGPRQNTNLYGNNNTTNANNSQEIIDESDYYICSVTIDVRPNE